MNRQMLNSWKLYLFVFFFTFLPLFIILIKLLASKVYNSHVSGHCSTSGSLLKAPKKKSRFGADFRVGRQI